MLVLFAPTLTLRLATRDFLRGSFTRLDIHGCPFPNRLLPDGQVSKVQASTGNTMIRLYPADGGCGDAGAPLTPATATAAGAARAGVKTI